MPTTSHHIIHHDDGNVECVIEIPAQFDQELRQLAADRGVEIRELLVDFVVTAFRVNPQRNYPSFTVPQRIEPPFVADGFRTVERRNGKSTLCAYNGVSLETAAAAMQESLDGITEQELLEVV